MLCPIIINSNTIERTVHASCYLGLGLTLCYIVLKYLGKAATNWIIKISKHDVQTIAFLCIFCRKCCKSDIAIGLVLQYNCNHKNTNINFGV